MNLLSFSPPNKNRSYATWGRTYGCSKGLALANAIKQFKGLTLIVTPNIQTAHILENELAFFGDRSFDVLVFPDTETLPYDVFSPHEDIISERLLVLSTLAEIKHGALIVSVRTMLSRLASKSFVREQTIRLARHHRIDLQAFRKKLANRGYQYVSQVTSHGEFAVRGAIIDLYPMGHELPFRIDLLDDEIESIRTFSPENQVSIRQVHSVQVLPAREFPVDEGAITRFRQNYRIQFSGDPNKSMIYRGVSNGNLPAGIEYYLPLFYEKTDTFINYVPANSQVVLIEDAVEIAEAFENEVFSRYKQRRHDVERPPLPPEQLWMSKDVLIENLAGFNTIQVQKHELEHTGHDRHNLDVHVLPRLAVNTHAEDPASELRRFINNHPCKILFVAESAGRREYLLDVLEGFELHPVAVTGWQAFLERDTSMAIAIAPLDEGLWLQGERIAIVTESNLFGARTRHRYRRPARDAETLIQNLSELNEDSPVVHEEHGIGRYRGLKMLTLSDMATEFLTIEYAGGDMLYVPVSSLHLVSRYTGAAEEHAPLHRLGGDAWKKIKQRAVKKVRDVAAELLDVYSRREAKQGYQYVVDHHALNSFCIAFPYVETLDQQSAIDEVLADMEKPRPMDRVVCGDVGFGKTEVAMRAAFVATMVGKQVVVLVPTTLLAAQHFQTFRDRFADWPVRIEHLSRFISAKNEKAIRHGLENGGVDVVIGTHKLLRAKFKNLGLIVVDEEQRFGVRQKETLKKMRAEVDVLTLTATPIPRTLNMSLSGLRNISIIATPPNYRHAIKTFMGSWNNHTIKEACRREIDRGGQVFFLHNEVKTIAGIAENIRQLLPDASINVAHGQMPERELERVMLDFYHQRFSILVCTTIIENGIDIPSANTIIIHRADKLGLAQLHQIRGRVGRSHHRAYAYLIVPPKSAINPDAVKRLEAIESLENLGAGFTLATHDLEIRGGGELLGAEQSGQIREIGFTLYNDLLARAVTALKSGEIPELDPPLEHDIDVSLGVPALLPEDYVPDVHARLVLYKRIAKAETLDDLYALKAELIDRFGTLPEFARNLFLVTQLKIVATGYGVTRIEAGCKDIHMHFVKKPNIDVDRLLSLIENHPKAYKLHGAGKLTVYMETNNGEERLNAIANLLNELSLKQAVVT